MRLLKKQDRILFLSRQSDTATIDVRMLHRHLRENYGQIPCTVLAREIGPGLPGLIRYIPFMFRQMIHLAISRVVILDGYCIPVCILSHGPETTVIQMWHALAAIKKFGYQTVGMPSGRSPAAAEALQMHRNYDYVLCCSRTVGEQFRQGFQVPADRLLYMGLPRIDAILRQDPREREEAMQRLDIPRGKELVLYVPTFRRNRPTDWRPLAAALDPGRFLLILKLHELDVRSRAWMEEEMKAAGSGGLTIINGDIMSTYQWLHCCDRIITDYSSLGVEAALLDKPLYFYVADIEDYCSEVGLNMDPRRELPRYTACSPEELADLMEQPWESGPLEDFRARYISVPTDHCTEDLAAFAAGLLEKQGEPS